MRGRPDRDGGEAVEGAESPLDAAVAARDRAALAMVRDAIARGDVGLAYQPVVAAAPGHAVAFHEGLIRVFDDSGRVIPARDFIAAAETTETGRLLDCLALDRALADLARVPGLRLSVNMSARSIGYPRWLQTLDRALARQPDAAERLILEISEASALLVPDILAPFMAHLRRRGIAFALDDFGAGATSFRHLRDVAFDAVKIDGQFIRGIAGNPDNQCVLRAMLAVAEQFDMFAVAEAVETEEEAGTLARLGVRLLQGYLFGAPTLRPPWAEATARRRAG